MEIMVDQLDFTVLNIVDESGNRVSINLEEELSINESNIDREMMEQPSKYVYWASLLEKVKHYQESAEMQMDLVIAELDKAARLDMERNTPPIKPTKDSVDAYIKRTEQYKVAREQCNYYTYIVRRLTFIVKSFEQRKDMLQSFGRYITNERMYGHGAGRHIEKTFDNP